MPDAYEVDDEVRRRIAHVMVGHARDLLASVGHGASPGAGGPSDLLGTCRPCFG